MKVFVISDLHLGHANIIKLCKRPFKNVEEMNKAIIDNWNSVVGEDDLVYVLGDFSFKGMEATHYLNQLNGKIVLIKGNHDRYFKNPKLISMSDYKEIEIEGVTYILSHYPIISWNHAFKDSIHLYGHVHSTGKEWEFVNLPNAHSVCCEFHNYTPVEITKFKPVNFVKEMTKRGKL